MRPPKDAVPELGHSTRLLKALAVEEVSQPPFKEIQVWQHPQMIG